MSEKIAKVISIVFHPVLIPTLGFLLLLNSGFYYTMLTWEAKKFILLVVFFTTAILPLLSIAILALSPNFNISMQKSKDRIIPLLTTAVYYYLGFMMLKKITIFPAFKLYFLASVLVIIILMIISFKWKISMHMAAIGGLTATVFALSFRSGINPLLSLISVVLISGIVATARLLLKKHDLQQLAAGYSLGFTILYFVVYFI